MAKWAIITGASAGLGKALVLQLAKHDLKILAIGRSLARLNALQQQSEHNIKVLALDISHVDDAASQIDEAIPAEDTISYLVHNAATIFPVKPFREISYAEWTYAHAVNFNAPFFITQRLIPKLEHGRVLHISTGLAHYPMAGLAAYCCTKASLYMLYKCLELELKSFSISVGSVKPGVMNTPMQYALRHFSKTELPDVDRFKSFKKQHALAPPELVARFIEWLLMQTTAEKFSEKEWDVRDEWHHKNWLN